MSENIRISARALGLIGLLGGLGGAILLAASAVDGADQDAASLGSVGQTPPQVVFAGPGRFFGVAVDLTRIDIGFGVPVTGVEASDLTVNGSPATQLVREDENYVFTGYQMPPPGEVEAVLAPGKIRRDPSGIPFEGYSWRFQLFDPARDEDGDGLTNAYEVKELTNPLKADSDEDGLPDPFEDAHSCLNPVADQAHPLSYTGEPLPGDNDADDDGVPDLEEFRRGTDPCAP